ncbi:hypothetical protein [Gimesia maris]|uniref:hypothetical protein n=1 Tax=Gimesia maris TaxID=122 RepID=UPI0012B8E7E6|nr:hypothetical protein [Gimesia maris]
MMLVAVLLLTGCEASLETPENPADNATVSGTVKLNGKPVKTGQVGFFSLKFGMAGQAELNGEGKFTLPDPIAPGEYRIYFAPQNGQTPGGMPEKYMTETSSDYIVTVKDGANQLSIDIKS